MILRLFHPDRCLSKADDKYKTAVMLAYFLIVTLSLYTYMKITSQHKFLIFKKPCHEEKNNIETD